MKSEICVASDHSRVGNVSTEHLKHFKRNSGHGINFYLRAGPRPVQRHSKPAMHGSDSEPLSDDSGAGDDPLQSSAVPNSLLQLQGDYASGSDSVVLATPEKSDEMQERRSDSSDYHTPAQPSKRRRLPTPSPTTRKSTPPVPARE